MFLEQISINFFRNYEKEKVIFSKGINIIVGNNAQGKTNLLEAIYFLGTAKSHLSYLEESLIKEEKPFLKITGTFSNDSKKIKAEIKVDSQKKSLKIGNKEIKSISEYSYNTKMIIFNPEDLNIIKDGPEIRRSYIDARISQIEKNYSKLLTDYNKLIKIRNEYIEKKKSHVAYNQNYFDIITEYYIKKSLAIYNIRKKYVDKINLYIGKVYKNFSAEAGLKIVYFPNFEIKDSDYEKSLKMKIEKNLNKEMSFGKTLYGAHRDDFEFNFKGKNLKLFGSQGQQRMAIIAFKLAELEIIKKYIGEIPILLLDDVFSELDAEKQGKLLKYISNKMQVFITTTDVKSVSNRLLKNAKIYEVEKGKVTLVEEKNG